MDPSLDEVAQYAAELASEYVEELSHERPAWDCVDLAVQEAAEDTPFTFEEVYERMKERRDTAVAAIDWEAAERGQDRLDELLGRN